MPIPVWSHPDQFLSNPMHEWDKRGFRPHPETSRRIEAILGVLQQHPQQYTFKTPAPIPQEAVLAVHDEQLLVLYHHANALAPGEWFYPTSFPKANPHQLPAPQRLEDVGYYCQDTSTWFCGETVQAIMASAACAYAGAQWLAGEMTYSLEQSQGQSVAQSGRQPLGYALSRPPGHHASRTLFGGYCYLNNSAIAAHALTQAGHRVAIVDVDYHHGDGTQEIFYHRGDVLTVSIHADPTERFPYYTGFAQELGLGAGEGANLNVVLPPFSTGETFINALNTQVLPAVETFQPTALVIPFGGDTLAEDTVGDFALSIDDVAQVGQCLAQLRLPTLVVQEGGYNPDVLGLGVHAMLSGLSC